MTENQEILCSSSDLVGIVRLPGQIQQDQIKSEIVLCWRLYISGGSGDLGNDGRCSLPALSQVRFAIEDQGAHRSQSPCVDCGRCQNSVSAQIAKLRLYRLTYYTPGVSYQYALEERQGCIESTRELPQIRRSAKSYIIVATGYY